VILHTSFTLSDYNSQRLMLVLLLSLLAQAAAATNVILRTFDDDKVGSAPAGFSMAAGREATADHWVVQRDGTGRVLAHLGAAAPRDSFTVAIYNGAQYRDVEVSARLKILSGGRTAGLVWRYQDPQNYHAVQLDLARQELAMYRVVSGNRIRIEHESDLELDPAAWHFIKLEQEGDYTRLYLGGIRVFSDRDRRQRPAGSVGLWASGDTVVWFDNFQIEPETDERRRQGR
jgi:hypothetical protein